MHTDREQRLNELKKRIWEQVVLADVTHEEAAGLFTALAGQTVRNCFTEDQRRIRVLQQLTQTLIANSGVVTADAQPVWPRH